MAKIDTSGIEGYENMTAEQKVSALEALEYEDGRAEIERLKNSVSNANKEAADWKKKHNQLLSDEERKQQEAQQTVEDMKAELELLKKEKAVSQYTASALSIGIGEKEAETISNSIVDGDFIKVFDVFGKFLKEHDHEIEVRLLQNTPTPPGSDGEKAITKEDFKKMDAAARLKFSQEHPDEYKKLYGGN